MDDFIQALQAPPASSRAKTPFEKWLSEQNPETLLALEDAARDPRWTKTALLRLVTERSGIKIGRDIFGRWFDGVGSR